MEDTSFHVMEAVLCVIAIVIAILLVANGGIH